VKKLVFKAIVDSLRRRKRSFSKIANNPGGTKMYKQTLPTSRRGVDGTMRW